jgi:hypothetical protein
MANVGGVNSLNVDDAIPGASPIDANTRRRAIARG